MDYEVIARDCRLKVLDLIYKAQVSHIGSNFSCTDIMSVLFSNIDLDKDKFILSKGWAAASLYYFLWKKGRMTEEELDTFCIGDSKYIGLAEPVHPDIPFAGGSMCMGLAAGVGFALAKKIKGEPGTIYILESDGGMQGGITWEALAFASQHKLDNLILLIDKNGLQAMGKTWEIYDLVDRLKERVSSFGWITATVDGHDFEKMERVFSTDIGGPTCIILETVKGKGVSFMENNNLYHYKQLSEDEMIRAKEELSK